LKDLPQRTLKRQFGDLQTKSLLGMWCLHERDIVEGMRVLGL
jgi:hypothetical protein